MPTLLQIKSKELDDICGMSTAIQDKVAGEDRELTDLERDTLRQYGERAAKLREECAFLNDQVKSVRAWADLRADIGASADQPSRDDVVTERRQASGQAVETRGWGDLFTESDAFRSYPGAGTSQRVQLPFDLENRAAISLATFPAGIIPPHIYTPAAFNLATPLLTACGRVTTGSNAVSWVQWAPNPASAATVVAEGEVKPEATMTATAVSDTLDTYAHWKGITRLALEDIPQIRSIVEGRLRQGIVVALEAAVLAALGAATLPPVNGSAAGGDTLLALIRQAIATVQAAGYARPNAVLINPADAADIDIAMMGGTLNGAVVNGSVWGVPLIPVTGVPAGTAYVGDFSTAVVLFTRSQTDVYLTDSHADYFVRNILLILAEQRALATVPDPAAAAEVTLGA